MSSANTKTITFNLLGALLKVQILINCRVNVDSSPLKLPAS